MSSDTVSATYRRLMFQKAGELSKRYGGLRNIPARLLEENGIGLVGKGKATSVRITLPSQDVMRSRIAEAQPTEKPLAKQVERFKPDPEPTPSQFKAEVTMEDFWVEQGWYKIDKKGWRLTRARWKDDEQLQREAIVFLVEQILQIDPRDVTKDDFQDNRLGGLLIEYYSGSPYKAVSEAFPELKIEPWEMSATPKGFYEEKENRVTAVKWLVERLGKDPRDVTKDDFRDNGLRGLLIAYYSGSPYKAVSEAFPELDIREWEMLKTSGIFYKKKENRISAIKWLVEKVGKDPKDITADDFQVHRVGGLLSNHYSNSPYQAISEAFPELKIEPWEMSATPKGFYEEKENRVTAVKWLVERLGKDPREVTADDFRDNGLSGLMTTYYFGPYRALREAGLVTEEDRRYIRGRGGRISKPNNKS